MMTPDTRIWALLVALTVATTALSGVGGGGAPVAAGLLALAWLKARLILGGFLGLARAPGWLSAFTVPLALWLLLIGGLHALVLR